jgi:hypothetical protein
MPEGVTFHNDEKLLAVCPFLSCGHGNEPWGFVNPLKHDILLNKKKNSSCLTGSTLSLLQKAIG